MGRARAILGDWRAGRQRLGVRKREILVAILIRPFHAEIFRHHARRVAGQETINLTQTVYWLDRNTKYLFALLIENVSGGTIYSFSRMRVLQVVGKILFHG